MGQPERQLVLPLEKYGELGKGRKSQPFEAATKQLLLFKIYKRGL